MKNFVNKSRLLKGALFGFLVLITIASPFPVFLTNSQPLELNIAFAATPACTEGTLSTNSDGSWDCTVHGGESTGDIVTHFKADGTGNGNSTTNPTTGVTVARDANNKPITQTTDCSSLLISMANPFTCMFRSLVSNTAASLIWIARWILVFSGALFNWLVDNTIVNFAKVYTSDVQKAVQNAWTAFRDVANILIIGIFTFIAISIILGLKTFGEKKLIANVLIVAVLINFSLLFTEIIIDASNFTASQIYTAAALGTVSPTGSGSGSVAVTAANVTGANAGIGGQFIYLLGVQSYGDTKTALDNIAQAQDNGWIALFHGLFVFVILVAAAAVLFYGSFLLVTRVILIMFLMVTASVAFASHLVPQWGESQYGWKTWWKSLIRSAILAPVLMFFLWMTLSISYAIHGAAGSGSFGDMIAHPTAVADTNTFVNYAIILGLLFVSFKLSSIFSSKIAGFNLAALVPGTGLGIAGAVTGLLGSTTLGWGGRAVKAVAKDNNWANQGVLKRSAARVANTLATTSYNPLKQPVAAKVAKSFGVPGALVGKGAIGASSFEDQMKAKAKHADEIARAIGPSETGNKKIEAEGRERFKEQSRQQKELIRQQAETKEQLIGAFKQGQTARPQTEINANAAEARKKDSENAKRILQQQQESEVRIAEAREASGQAGPNETVAAVSARHRTEMQTAEARIKAASDEVITHRQALVQMDQEANAHAENQEEFKNLSTAVKSATENLDALGKGKTEAEAEAEAGKKAKENAAEALRRALLWDPRAASSIKSVMQNHERDENLKRIATMLPKESGGHAPAAAHAPAATPAAAPKPAAASSPASSGGGGGDSHGAAHH